MQDDALNGSEAQKRFETLLDAALESALRRPPDVRVPEGFRSRVLAQVPATSRDEAPEYSWPLIAAAATIVALGAGLWWAGELPAAAEALRQPVALAAAVGIEAALSLFWVWRVARAG